MTDLGFGLLIGGGVGFGFGLVFLAVFLHSLREPL
jgi:hypothetical protein